MPQNLVIMKLFEAQAIDPAGTAVSGIIDMRDYVRIESLWLLGASSAGTPKVTLEWVGGISQTQFQDWAENDDLTTNSTSETWEVLYPPDFKAPYVKFRLTSAADAHADSTYTLYAYVREDFA